VVTILIKKGFVEQARCRIYFKKNTVVLPYLLGIPTHLQQKDFLPPSYQLSKPQYFFHLFLSKKLFAATGHSPPPFFQEVRECIVDNCSSFSFLSFPGWLQPYHLTKNRIYHLVLLNISV